MKHSFKLKNTNRDLPKLLKMSSDKCFYIRFNKRRQNKKVKCLI